MATTTVDVVASLETVTVVGDNGTANIQAGTTSTPNTNTATGVTVEGDAAVIANTVQQVGSLNSTFDIGNAGTLSVSEVSTTTATGTSVDGTATVYSDYSSKTGGILDYAATNDDIVIGAGGVIGVTVDNTATAAATSTAADATATAEFWVGSFGVLDSDVTAGADGSLTANVDANAVATATTVGAVGAAADAIAAAKFTGDTAAIFATAAGEGDISIGDAGTVIGTAGVTADPLSLSATATSTTGNATADATAADIIGIGGDGTKIEIGNAGTVTAAAVVGASSSATTITGDGIANAANANTEVDLVAALGTGAGSVDVGSDALITAVAASTSSATAASTDGADKATSATVNFDSLNQDVVVGIDLDKLVAGNNAQITASATSSQTATASTVNGANSTATATVAAGDLVAGILTTDVTVDNDASLLSVAATLTGAATSSNVNGSDSTSEAGLGSQVFGIGGSSVTVGDNLTGVNGLRVDAVSNLTATATGVDGTANADAGDSNAAVIAVDDTPIDIGNSGNITAVAASTLNATATSTALGATAVVYQTGDGVLDSKITIGNDGNLIGQTTLVGNAAATTTGADGAPATAIADLTLDGNGISQAAAQAIDIGDIGNVTGTSLNSGGAIAQTTYGDAIANGDVKAEGIELTTATSNITVGGAGNVTGLAVLGTLNASGNLANQIQVTAASVSGDADAIGTFDGGGIMGVEANEATITAGPRDGDISGQVFAGGNVVASTTNAGAAAGDATATISPSNLFGISNVDLIGGQAGTNLVRGTAVGDFDATAISVDGNATGKSTVDAYGIFGGATNDTLTVNGGVTAIAQLSNTVTATSVAGNAVATATSNAIGLSNYDVTIIGGGTLTASASSNASSNASSVGGNV